MRTKFRLPRRLLLRLIGYGAQAARRPESTTLDGGSSNGVPVISREARTRVEARYLALIKAVGALP